MDYRDYASLEQVVIGSRPSGEARESARNRLAAAWISLFQRDYPYKFANMYDRDGPEGMSLEIAKFLDSRALIKRLNSDDHFADRPTGLWKLAYEAMVKSFYGNSGFMGRGTHTVQMQDFGHAICVGHNLVYPSEFNASERVEKTYHIFDIISHKNTKVVDALLFPTVDWDRRRIRFVKTGFVIVEYDFAHHVTLELTVNIPEEIGVGLKYIGHDFFIGERYGSIVRGSYSRSNGEVDKIIHKSDRLGSFIVNSKYLIVHDGLSVEGFLRVYDHRTLSLLVEMEEGEYSSEDVYFRPVCFLSPGVFLMFNDDVRRIDTSHEKVVLTSIPTIDKRNQLVLSDDTIPYPYPLKANTWATKGTVATLSSAKEGEVVKFETGGAHVFSVFGRHTFTRTLSRVGTTLTIETSYTFAPLVSGVITDTVGVFVPGDYCANTSCAELKMPLFDCSECGVTVCSESCLGEHMCFPSAKTQTQPR